MQPRNSRWTDLYGHLYVNEMKASEMFGLKFLANSEANVLDILMGIQFDGGDAGYFVTLRALAQVLQ